MPGIFKSGIFVILLEIVTVSVLGQEVYFFSEGTSPTFYDQGIVDKNNLGQSTFEFTYPPGAPQYNDKVPCSNTAYKGTTSLKFNYFSSENGSWKVSIYRSGWTSADISKLDSVSFYIFSNTSLPASALPLIGLRGAKKGGGGDISTGFYKLSDYNQDVAASKWTKIRFPIGIIMNDNQNSSLDFSQIKGVLFGQSETNNTPRLVFIDEITAFKSIQTIPQVFGFKAAGYDSHAELTWTKPFEGLSFRIYASFDGGLNYRPRGETTENQYLDFVPAEGKNRTVNYRIVSILQEKESEPVEATAQIRDFSDEELLDMLQRYTFRYFWEGAHQATGMALERSNSGASTAASGATGMGLMAMIVAYEREYKPRDEIKDRILMILGFLEKCERHHGAWSHWYNADTYKTRPFSPDDDGGDIVETSFVTQGLIALKHYFAGSDTKSVMIRQKADQLWKEVDWDWYRQYGQNVLYWHWSPNFNFQKNMKVSGWNECQVTYIMAASSPTHGVPKEVYTQGWARNGDMVRNRTYYNLEINLAPDWGGPLFFIHYSNLGINPHGLKDQYADYWKEFVNTAKIHYEYSIANPLNHRNYSDKNWGLTASDDPFGYAAHKPMNNDNGTISPTAALASMPYTPAESIKALKYFYRERGAELFGKYGPYDAFNDNLGWVKKAYIGIDQGPIIVMVENYRTQLLWKYVMMDKDIQAGLEKLGFQYEVITNNRETAINESFQIYPNPANDKVMVYPKIQNEPFSIKIYSMDGKLKALYHFTRGISKANVDISEFSNGIYMVQLLKGDSHSTSKLIVRK